jgi:Xaa-Pro aminopeptidase
MTGLRIADGGLRIGKAEIDKAARSAIALCCGLLLLGAAFQATGPSRETSAAQSAIRHPPSAIGITQEVKRRRSELMQKLGPQAMLVLFSAEPRKFERDVDYEFRQDSNLFYLTGIDQAGTTLVLMPGNPTQREILFLAPQNPTLELWTGKMLSQDEARTLSGIETIYEATSFDAFMDAILSGRHFGPRNYGPTVEYKGFFDALADGTATVYLTLEERPKQNEPLNRIWQFADQIRDRFVGVQVKDVSRLIHPMRLVKSAYELAQLRRAIEITCQAQRGAMQAVKPGMYEYEVEAIIEFVFRKNGAPWPGFPSIVGSGPNATTLHYDKSTRQMRDGEVLLTDIGAEFNYYTADVTRTYPVNGRFAPEQAAIYNLVLKAQTEAMKIVRPGATIPQVHARAVAVLSDGLLELGLITSKQDQQYRMWFPHGTSHWLGMNAHDVGDQHAKFEPGMVLTVEPGLYIRQDTFENWRRRDEKTAAAIEPAVKKYMGIGVRIEDDAVVTESGFEVLSDKAPRTIAEIEALQRGK